jgi:hypothetical protein
MWNKAGVVPAEKLELFSYENNFVSIGPVLVILLSGVAPTFYLMWHWVTFSLL